MLYRHVQSYGILKGNCFFGPLERLTEEGIACCKKKFKLLSYDSVSQSIILFPLFYNSDGDEILKNKDAGHLFKTKHHESGEGGIMVAGAGIDTPCLF